MICTARCRYCLRSHYNVLTLKEEELIDIAKFCGSKGIKEEVREVLITGGDPLVIPHRLNLLVESLLEYAPNVKIVRIGTRLMTQDPDRIDNNVFEIFKNKPGIRFEIGTQINHPVEFFPESIEKFQNFEELDVRIYAQNVLLKNINDNINCLIRLYDILRNYNIEPHYLFHCVPMIGMHHFRTTVEKGLNLAKELINSGNVSGRAKPMYALMTDIGKIVPYERTILGKNDHGQILLQSAYKYEDRIKWNPNWQLPKTAEVDETGYLRVWYLDGED
jgi:lysine 2,3-aminomutase